MEALEHAQWIVILVLLLAFIWSEHTRWGLQMDLQTLRCELNGLDDRELRNDGQNSQLSRELGHRLDDHTRRITALEQAAGHCSVLGICCACGYNGAEETHCPKRADETHCKCWWEDPESPDPGAGSDHAFDAARDEAAKGVQGPN